ncbi:acryloyl-CoA reductase [Metabacillus sp. GX 13764]|uniref:NADPH:quinone oxidoreductase family protein n=1 Tax=Metabacillus kandeliae TaxID=2900151 RepID=UPI001E617D43|nr:acryloyl-CoA reductase [Metabacillus kandeliae]MCD7034039.1 acryloyl-CoA reductase [Metabacillus kandeliae]
MNTFKALVLAKQGDEVTKDVKELSVDDLPEGDVLVKVSYSGVNYKDGLAGKANGNIVKNYPFVPGIDMSGTVVSSKDSRFKEGDEIIATSYEIGVSHYGGYSEYARLSGDWIVPLPEGLSLKEAMIFGTAGFTAALSVQRLEENGLAPEKGKVLVTGATGGVGSIAAAILAKRGYDVTASTGKESEHGYLRELGANEIIPREDVYNGELKPLDKQLWQGAVDPVGGKPLASVLSKIQQHGSVAVSGLTAGGDVPTSVFPFILRGINLLGIDSVYCPMEIREKLWKRMGDDLKPEALQQMVEKEITLEELPDAMDRILDSKVRGRILVKFS